MLENLLQESITQEGLNIDYDGNTATNAMGIKYRVTIQQSLSCFDVSTINNFNHEITLRTPCNESTEPGPFLAQNLAHQLGHSETYIPANLLFGLIGTIGITHSIKNKSFKTFFYTLATLGSYKLIIEETIAGFAASKYHGTVCFNYNETLRDFVSFGKNLIELF